MALRLPKHVGSAALALICAASLCACDSGTEAEYANSFFGCQLGETLYVFDFAENYVYNSGFSSYSGLCRDPLCTHDSSDSPCPDWDFFMGKSACRTDGRMIYFGVLNATVSAEAGDIPYEIYSYDPETASMKLLCSVKSTSNSFDDILYCDGYIYYSEGYYNEDYDPNAGVTTLDDQYKRFMRVSTDGGTPELLYDEDFNIGTSLCVDGYNYYIYDAYAAQLTARSRDDGSVKTIDLGEYTYIAATGYGDKIYIECSQKSVDINLTDDSSVSLTPIAVLSYDPASDKLSSVARDITGAPVISGGALWYTPFTAEVEYYGTKDMPTGRPGEVLPFDYYSFNTGEIVRLDLATGEKGVWDAGHDKYGQLEPNIVGWSDGCLLARLFCTRRTYENGSADYNLYILKLNDDGSVTVKGSLGDVTENY